MRLVSWFFPNLSEQFIEIFVQIQIYILAAIYVLKELWFEASNQGIEKKLLSEIESSPLVSRRSSHKVAIVTGADGTIGQQIVRRLVSYGFEIHAMVGSKEKAKFHFKDLLGSKKEGGQLKIYEIDLEDPYAVIEFGESLSCGDVRVGLVVLCAGIMLAGEKYLDGMESHMCVNVVSQAMLLDYIRIRLVKKARLIVLSSTCARAAYLRGNCISGTILKEYIGPYQAYAMSKLVLAAYVEELAKKESLNIASLHPGVVPGTLYRNLNIVSKMITYFILPRLLRTAKFSSLLVLHTALRGDFARGAYFEDCAIKDVPKRMTTEERVSVYNAVRKQIEMWKSDEEF